MNPRPPTGPVSRPKFPLCAEPLSMLVKPRSPERVHDVKSPVSNPQFRTRLPAMPAHTPGALIRSGVQGPTRGSRAKSTTTSMLTTTPETVLLAKPPALACMSYVPSGTDGNAYMPFASVVAGGIGVLRILTVAPGIGSPVALLLTVPETL